MKSIIKTSLLFVVLLSSTIINSWGQVPKVLIPSTPNYDVMDTTCYIPCGTLILPQGFVNYNGGINIAIPTNRFSWALSVAHAWNYTRNVLKMPNPKFSMDIWMGIAADESQLGCIPGMVWAPGRGSAFQVQWTSFYNGDGCYQMENGVAGGQWIGFGNEMQQHFPVRFVGASPAPYFSHSFERASLSMAYEFVKEMQWSRYKFGVDPYPIAINAADPLAIHKVFAAFHNNQTASFTQIPSFLYSNSAALQTNACWPDFGGLGNAAYLTKHGKMISVLQGLNTHCNYPSGSTKFEDFNGNIAWDTVQNYMNIIKPFYHEYTAAQWTTLTNKVKAKFIDVSGSISTSIPFKQLGPVIDAIILGLPKEDPSKYSLAVWPPNWDGKLEGWGSLVPTGKIGYDAKEFCLGTAYTLKSIVDGGESPDISFKWYKNGSLTPFATTRNIVETPTLAGTYTYKLEMCNSKGCLAVGCDVTVVVKNCNTCGMSVAAVPTNTPCQNMKAGSIALTIGGAASYTINYTGPVSGSQSGSGPTATISNLSDGVYNIEVVKAGDPTCKAVSTALIQYTTAQNVSLTGKVIDYNPKCQANLQADITANPAPCLWRVKFWQGNNFFFPAVTVLVTPGGNKPGAYQTDKLPPGNPWEYYGESQFYASTGDQIGLDLTIVPTPGASMITNMTFEIYNANNQLVQTYTAAANAVSSSNINYHVADYTATCPVPTGSPQYNFSWNPSINITATTNTQSKGNTPVSPAAPQVYTVTAANKTNTQCTLTDTVYVKNDATCIPTCTAPSTAPTFKSSTYSVCSPGLTKDVVVTLPTGVYYQLFNSVTNAAIGTSAGPTASAGDYTITGVAAGTYKVRVASSAANLTTATCFTPSVGITTVTVNPQPTVTATATPSNSVCVNTLVTLTGGGATTYTWDNSVTNGTAFSATTTKTYTVTGTDANGCINTKAITLTVNPLPTITATATPSATVCTGDNVTLKGGGGSTYTWDNSVTDNTAFTPLTNKTYTVTGTDANGCKNTKTIDITLSTPPTASITTSGAGLIYCANLSGVTLTAQSVPTASYEWFKGGTSQGAATVTNTFLNATAGSWSVKVSIGTCGATSTPVTVTASPLPIATSSATPGNALCLNDPVTLKGTSSTPSVTYSWDNGVTDNTAFTLDNASKFKTYTLTVKTADNCSATTTQILTQKAATAITTNPVASTTACVGESKTLTVIASGAGTLTYQWYKGATPVGTNSASLNLNTIQTSDAGTYKVTVTGDCGTLTSTDAIVVVNDKPVITQNPTNTGGCVGSSAAFNVTATGAAPLTYQWKKAPATNVGTNDFVLSFTNLTALDAGSYTVDVTNTCGTTTSTAAVLTTPSNEIPDVAITADKTTICEGTAVTLTAVVKQGGGAAPKFTFKDGSGAVIGSTDQASNTVTTAALTNNQTYTVTLTSNSICLDPAATNPITSTPINVQVDTKPTGVSAGTNQNICTTSYTMQGSSLSPITATGKWTVKTGTGNFADNTTSNTNLTNLALGPNEYTWTVTNGTCTAVSSTVMITRTGTMTTPNAGTDITVCEGSTVNLAATALAGGETGKWTITPSALTITNSTSANATITNTASNSGNYTATWTISNGVCPDQADDVTIKIDQTPSAASLVANTITTCATQINLNANTPSTGQGTWSVTSGTGLIAPADLNNPTAQITALSGTTVLSWKVNNGVCPTSAGQTLTINQVGTLTSPTISSGTNPITATSLAICKNKTYSFTANAPGAGESCTWSSTSTNITALSGSTLTQNLVMNGIGTDTIVWTISSTVPGCTPQSKKVALIISDVPTAPAAITGAIEGCEGAILTQSVAPAAGVTSYNWTLTSATGTSSTSDIQVTLGSTTQATISVKAINTCGTGAATTKNITINQKPLAPVFTTAPTDNPTKVCSNQIANYSVTTKAGETYTWSWKKAINKTTTDVAIGSITTTAAITTAEVDTLIVTATNSCATGLSKKLGVSFNPLPTYTLPNDTVVCAGNPLPNLNISFTGKANYTVDLTFNAAPVPVPPLTSNNYSFPSLVGTYQLLSLTDANGCVNNTASKTVTVSQTALPATNFTLTGETVCSGSDGILTMSGSELGVTYLLYKKGSTTSIGTIVGTGAAVTQSISASVLNAGLTIIEADALGCAAAKLADTASFNTIGTITAIVGSRVVCDNNVNITKLPYSITPIAGATAYNWSINAGTVTGSGTNVLVDLSNQSTKTNFTLTVAAVLPNTSVCSNSVATVDINMIASYGEDTLVISEDSICIGLPISVSIKGRSADGYQNWRFPLGNVLKVSVLDSTEFLLYPTSSGVVSVTPVHSCNSSIAALTKDIIVYQMPIGTAGADQKYQGFPVGAKLQGLHANPELGVKYKYEWNVVKGTATIASANTLTTTILPKEVETHYQLTISSPNEKACVLVDEVIVMFEIVVNPPLIFSPNGDGKNDTWEVPELEFFPDASIEIFNQWGIKVYSKSKGYFTEPWNGTNEGVELPIATYYYVITPNKPGYSTKAGAVTLVK